MKKLTEVPQGKNIKVRLVCSYEDALYIYRTSGRPRYLAYFIWTDDNSGALVALEDEKEIE